ncbi:hypothetical protein [Herpetosiphon giganteus]|uniref:hypothetical protein n=1 Tax=Herpetosiphon giganteus TaxID=2029754 RepID=UPI00195AA98F|nr:hypothetical protein [Herpetosiphon giganteus]MBM7843734.1 hypothetical protein [Herpetosiphon giganteus]
MRWIRWCWLLLLIALPISAASGQEQSNNGLVWQVEPVFGTTYRPGEWMALRVKVSNTGVDRTVEIHVGNYNVELDVPGGSQKETLMYGQFDQAFRVPMALYLNGEKRETATLQLRSTDRPMVATLLEQPLPQLTKVVLVATDSKQLPNSAIGLDMLNGIALNQRAWGELSPEQHQAIKQWVNNGGMLLVEPNLLEDLPADLQPAQVAGEQAIATTTLSQVFLQPFNEASLNIALLQPNNQSAASLKQDQTPIFVKRPVGKGFVIAIAFNLDQQEIVAWRGYENMLVSLLPQQQNTGWMGMGSSENSIRDSNAPALLNNLPALDLPPLKTLLILLGIYIVLAGPVTYLVLRRLDRMALAWLTIPALTLIFAVLAYGIGSKQRGTDILVHDVALIYPDSDANATVLGYAGIFSPVRDEYQVTIKNGAYPRPLLVNPNMGGNNGGVNATRALYSHQPGDIRNLTINQWSMEMFAYEQSISDAPHVQIEISMQEKKIIGTVRNPSKYKLNEAAFIMLGNAQKFGTIEPGAEKSIELQINNNPSMSGASYLLFQKELDAGYQTPSGPPRDLLAKTQALDIALPNTYSAIDRNAVFVAFVDFNQSVVDLPEKRFAATQRSLLVQYPQLSYSQNVVELNNNWFSYTMEEDPNMGMGSACTTSARGSGTSISQKTGIIQLNLPATLSSIEAQSLRFLPTIDGGMVAPNKVTYELYNWVTGQWDGLSFKNGALDLTTNPSDYLQQGSLRMRYTIDPSIDTTAGLWGCFSVGPVLTGVVK